MQSSPALRRALPLPDNIRRFTGQRITKIGTRVHHNIFIVTGRPIVLQSVECSVELSMLQALEYGDRHASRISMYNPTVTGNYVNCELTRYEFAESLGLEVDSMFVDNMFKMVDKNDNGFISFREFLDFFIIFSNGLNDLRLFRLTPQESRVSSSK